MSLASAPPHAVQCNAVLALSTCVTRSTSSYVVRPACAFAIADDRNVCMPAARAAADTAPSFGVDMRTARIDALTGSTSNTPRRPR